MATTEERMQILKMIEEGKITAQDGAELLRALDQDNKPPTMSFKGASAPRWFRVRVTDMATGRAKVNVNIPRGLDAIQSGQHGKIMDVTDEEDGERVEIFVE